MDFEFSNKSRALEWQQKVPSQYQREYERAIGKVLDQYDDGRCQQIDKIIVDLGTLSEDRIAGQLGKALEDTLKKVLLKNVQHYGIANIDPRTKATVDVRAISSKEELFFIFQYFITHGSLPWNSSKTSISELELQLRQQFTISKLAAVMVSNKVFQGTWERARFFHQFEAPFVTEIFAQYFEKPYNTIKMIADFCEQQFRESRFDQYFKKQTSSQVSSHILEWMALVAPENDGLWPADFVPWYIEQRWISEIPFSYVSIWVSAELLIPTDSTAHYLTQHLKKIFKHLDLHLTAISQDGQTMGTTALDEGNEPPIPFIPLTETNATSDLKKEVYEGTAEQDPSLEKDTSGMPKEVSIDPNPDPLQKDRAIDPVNDQNGEPKDSETGHKDTQYPNAKSGNNDSEEPGKSKEEPGKSKEEDKEGAHQEFLDTHLPTANETVMSPSDLSGPFSKEHLIPSKEFYKEVEETLDAEGLEGKERWETGKDSDLTSTDPYYIHDSGIVLVWPYLHRLFENLNYVSDKEFVTRDLQERAVMLLGYIATGDASCGEHQLVLAKFLCGWPFRMPVKKSIKLTKQELKEANAMLTGLISHWSVLKNTSINGLRETFFYREGKLEPQEEVWKLTVEQKGTDILLDRLPYGISIIKLPWLKILLRVDWA